MDSKLKIEFCGVECENPFFLASSPISGNYEMVARAFEQGWGGAVYKTVGVFAAEEVSPRFDQLAKLNNKFLGFRNLEQISEYPLADNLRAMEKLKQNYPDKIIIASIMGRNKAEWTKLAELVTEVGADIIECNFSCPQMSDSELGSDVGQNEALVAEYMQATIAGSDLPVLAKMTPNLAHMVPPAMAAVKAGAAGLAAINTIKSITSIDLDYLAPKPVIRNKSAVAGYSGKAVKPIALRFIQELASYSKLKDVPLSGIGGIENWKDALEFMLLGASNLQIGTAVMQYGYRIIDDLIEGLTIYLAENKIARLADLVGKSLANVVAPDQLDRNTIIYPEIKSEKCVGCGRCYISCNDGGHQAISWNKARQPEIKREKCVGCLLCQQLCPVEAIEYSA